MYVNLILCLIFFKLFWIKKEELKLRNCSLRESFNNKNKETWIFYFIRLIVTLKIVNDDLFFDLFDHFIYCKFSKEFLEEK